MSERAPSGWQGPLRAAAAVFVVGVLVVWLVKPIGNPCPDLERLPQGSAASSSPSFSPPGSRTCTYTAAGGTKAMSKYVPWLDWIVLLLLAAVVAGAVRALSPAGKAAGEARPRDAPARAERLPRAEAERPPRAAREPQAERPPLADLPPRAERPPPAEPSPRAEREPRVEPPPPASSAGGLSERDAAERERARQERAARRRR